MDRGKRVDIKTLDELAAGELPQAVIEEIKDVEITVGDLVNWYRSQPKFRFLIQDGKAIFDLHVKLPTKRLAVILGSTGIVGGLIALLKQLLHL